MPYIKNEDRLRYDAEIEALVKKMEETAKYDTISVFAGHLNYILTTVIKKSYLAAGKVDGWDIGYDEYNSMIGMLECCKLELYRRVVSPYEDKKIKSNGDV